MRCTLCKLGETSPGMVTVTLERGEATVIIKEVPGQVCENCGEYYLDQAVAERVLSMAEDAVSRNTEVEIIRFAA
ncbi:MAG: type II toxin-antitoxin system MqsA family antitoxin [Desulfomonile tiedjei]|nr:type II toxin-antitoxin system MqsA family antitoxin [Desulfomonile tiedjei]